MPSITCPRCLVAVPDGALSCPQCGFPISEGEGTVEPPVWPDPVTRQPPKDFAGSAFAGCFFALLGGTLGFILGIGDEFVFFPDAGGGNAGFGLGAKFVVFPSL